MNSRALNAAVALMQVKSGLLGETSSLGRSAEHREEERQSKAECNKRGGSHMRIPHELRDEFSNQVPLIELLLETNYEFGRLAAAYDEVNSHIWRIESEDEPTTDEVLERLKKRRLLLKDDIAALLTKERPRI